MLVVSGEPLLVEGAGTTPSTKLPTESLMCWRLNFMKNSSRCLAKALLQERQQV